jgi:hypothetical protein
MEMARFIVFLFFRECNEKAFTSKPAAFFLPFFGAKGESREGGKECQKANFLAGEAFRGK